MNDYFTRKSRPAIHIFIRYRKASANSGMKLVPDGISVGVVGNSKPVELIVGKGSRYIISTLIDIGGECSRDITVYKIIPVVRQDLHGVSILAVR